MQIVQTILDSFEELIGSSIKFLPSLLAAGVVLMLTRYAAQASRGVAERVGERTVRSKSLQLLFEKSAYVATWALGILTACVLSFPGLSLGDIIATLGLGSVAIGFAFQDVFKNFLAGILLLLQEPFRIGDQIVVGDYEGTVERIDIRTTKIRTYAGERVLVPNADLFTSPVRVKTAFESRRTDLAVGVDYNTVLPDAIAVLLDSLKGVEGIDREPVPEVDIIGFGDSSIDLVARYWTASTQTDVRRVQSRAAIAIKQAFDRAAIGIPYPIRTLYFYNQQQYRDSAPIASPQEPSDATF